MENQNIPQIVVPPLDIAKMKDRILMEISELDGKALFSDELYKTYQLADLDISLAEFHAHIKDMFSDGFIFINELDKQKIAIRYITDKGRVFLKYGGYSKKELDKLQDGLDKTKEEEKRREKLDLEIQSLRAGMKHYKNTRIIAIIALVISGLSFIYLLTKDILLKFILPNN